jgi:zinc protease
MRKYFMRWLLKFLLVMSIITSVCASPGQVSEYQLSNGLKLIVKEDHRSPVVVSQVWYKVGSSYESQGITGISHFLEHMMFRGTKKCGPGVLKKMIVEQGGYLNAGTNSDYTVYYEVLSADKLQVAFELEADRMQGLLLNKAAFDKEKQVVMEERFMRTHDNPLAQTYERFAATAYISSPYHHPVIGWMHDIRHLTVEDLRNWYARWYAPNNAIVVVVGDVQPENVYRLAKKCFGACAKKTLPTLKESVEQKPLGERAVIVKVPAKLPWLIMGYNVPTLRTAEETWEAYALELVAAVLDNGLSARLSKELIRKQSIATSVSANYPLYQRLDGLFVLEGIPEQKHTVDELKKAFFQQIEHLQTTLVTQKELDRIKTQAIAVRTYVKDSVEYQAQEIGSLEASGLSWKEADQYVQHITAITPEQIREVARKYLVSDRLTVGILKPLSLGD